MYVIPSTKSQFRAEIVTQDPAIDGVPKPTRRVSFSISPEGTHKIASLLESRALWAERTGRSGECTDQPVVTLDVVWKGQRRLAVRLSCASSDLTGSLIEAALSQAEKR